MKVIIKKILVTPVNAEKDQYRVDVLFKCECGHEYKVGDEDKDKMDEFLKTLEAGKPNKNISCPKCNPVN
jgi:hypothetical protein